MPTVDQIYNVVTYYFKKYNIKSGKLDTISDKVKEQLIEIETFIQKFLDKQKALKNEMKTYGKLSLVNVVESSGVPRSTVYYNKDTLKIYIEERIKEVEEEDILNLSKTGKLQENYEELKSYLERFQTNLVEGQFFELKIQELEKELTDLIKKNESVTLDLNKYRQENQKLKFELKKFKNNNILQFEES